MGLLKTWPKSKLQSVCMHNMECSYHHARTHPSYFSRRPTLAHSTTLNLQSVKCSYSDTFKVLNTRFVGQSCSEKRQRGVLLYGGSGVNRSWRGCDCGHDCRCFQWGLHKHEERRRPRRYLLCQPCRRDGLVPTLILTWWQQGKTSTRGEMFGMFPKLQIPFFKNGFSHIYLPPRSPI